MQQRWIYQQTHNIHVNNIKQQSTYPYKYDYIYSSLRNTLVSRSATLTTVTLMKTKSLIEFAFAESLLFNLNQINTALKRWIKNTPRKDEKSKQTQLFKDYEITKTNEIRLKTCGNRLFN